MISLAFIVIFIFCLAIAIASILISHQFISDYDTDFHKNYFYYLVSFYAFAIYAFWGQLLIRTVLVELTPREEVIETVANFLSILGLPFLLVSWIMLINMAHALFGQKVNKYWSLYHIGIFILLIAGFWTGFNYLNQLGHLDKESVGHVEIAFISVFGLINYSIFIFLIRIFNVKNNIKGQHKILNFSFLMVLAFLLQISVIVFAFMNVWLLATAILLFFASNLLPLGYLKIHSDTMFQPLKAENTSEEFIDQISRKYRITKRECEIMKHICTGKSNQQIADDLFISLQTVKDHTHRIYSKLGIRSRMQLVQMVNG